ncbi:MAG: P-II family nitrogen regulator [Candidatus Nitrosopumilus sp. bin_32a]
MIRIDVYLTNNEVMQISEALKKINVGGLTVIKKRGRGKKPPPEIHAGKGSMIFQPQFTEKYVIELVINNEMKDDAVKIIRENSTTGKIFVTPNVEMIDIKTGEINKDA